MSQAGVPHIRDDTRRRAIILLLPSRANTPPPQTANHTAMLGLSGAAAGARHYTIPHRFTRLLTSICFTASTARLVPAIAFSAFPLGRPTPWKANPAPNQLHSFAGTDAAIMGRGKKSTSSRLTARNHSTGGPDDGGDGVMMILSPAKTLDLTPFETPLGSPNHPTEPKCDVAKTRTIASAMKARNKAKDLEKLLGISANLAATAHKYWADFDADRPDRKGTKPAIYAFSGAAYQGLDVATCPERALSYMQSNLRIVDPLYGALRPLDLIQPYRLEMASKNVLRGKEMGDARDLAGWWRSSVTRSIAADLGGRSEKILVNLASDEYAAAVDGAALPDGTRYVKVVFQQEGRVIAVHAKRARGRMVRYLSKNVISDVDGIKAFSEDGYGFVEGRSSPDKLVFDRPKPPPKKSAPAKKKQGAGSAGKKSPPPPKRRRTTK